MKIQSRITTAFLALLFSALQAVASPEQDATAIWESLGMSQAKLATLARQTRDSTINKFKEGINKSTLTPEATLERLTSADAFGDKIEEAMKGDRIMPALAKFLTQKFTAEELDVIATFEKTTAAKKLNSTSGVKDFAGKLTQDILRPIIEEMKEKDKTIVLKHGGKFVNPPPSVPKQPAPTVDPKVKDK